VPDVGSAAARLRVRARLGDVTSPWATGAQVLVVEEPTAVQLIGYRAESTGRTLLSMAWIPLGALVLLLLGWGVRKLR
jgi:hypothetical protein